jgi:hypothetical protein
MVILSRSAPACKGAGAVVVRMKVGHACACVGHG